jgi:hypothetical protein
MDKPSAAPSLADRLEARANREHRALNRCESTRQLVELLDEAAAALRAADAESERLRTALDELLADYLTHMQENAYTEMARNALEAARKDGTC